jgi:hypothetical protein
MAARRSAGRSPVPQISPDPVATFTRAFRRARTAVLKARIALAACEDALTEMYGCASTLPPVAHHEDPLSDEAVERIGAAFLSKLDAREASSAGKELPASLRDLASPRSA